MDILAALIVGLLHQFQGLRLTLLDPGPHPDHACALDLPGLAEELLEVKVVVAQLQGVLVDPGEGGEVEGLGELGGLQLGLGAEDEEDV